MSEENERLYDRFTELVAKQRDAVGVGETMQSQVDKEVDFDNVTFYAFRYCLGRQTYVVAECVDILKRNWNCLTGATRTMIKAEITKAFEGNRYGSEIDRATWALILDLDDPNPSQVEQSIQGEAETDSGNEEKNPASQTGRVCKDIQAVAAEIKQRWANFVNFRKDPAITSARRMGDIETLLGIIEAVTKSARALCQQLRAVHDDLQYRNVWEVAQLHRGQYTGLTYTAELAALESAVWDEAIDTIKGVEESAVYLSNKSLRDVFIEALEAARDCSPLPTADKESLRASLVKELESSASLFASPRGRIIDAVIRVLTRHTPTIPSAEVDKATPRWVVGGTCEDRTWIFNRDNQTEAIISGNGHHDRARLIVAAVNAYQTDDARDEYIKVLEREIKPPKMCPNCEVPMGGVHCCHCEGCDGCRENEEEEVSRAAPQPIKPAEGLNEALRQLRWYGHTIAGGGPMIGYERPAKEAERYWYSTTLPLLERLGAVYGDPPNSRWADNSAASPDALPDQKLDRNFINRQLLQMADWIDPDQDPMPKDITWRNIANRLRTVARVAAPLPVESQDGITKALAQVRGMFPNDAVSVQIYDYTNIVGCAENGYVRITAGASSSDVGVGATLLEAMAKVREYHAGKAEQEGTDK